MPNNKLKDNEIIKALECCSSGSYGCENGCPLDKECDSPIRGGEKIMKSALDLINRQDALIEKFEKVEHFADKTIATLNAENESLKTEVERLQNAYKQCAWERDIFAEDMTQEIKKDCSYLMLDIKTIKAEAYKEFAERLKATFPKNSRWVKPREKVDSIVKEMVGE